MAEARDRGWPVANDWRTPGRHGRQEGQAGLVVAERTGMAMALVTVRTGGHGTLAEVVQAHYGIALPAIGKRIARANLTLTGIGPGQWLAEMPSAPADGIERVLRSSLAIRHDRRSEPRAHYSPDGRATRARRVGGRNFPGSASPRVRSRRSAQTIVSHIGVQIWQLGTDPIYEIAVPRSQIGSIWRWLVHAALRHGLEVRPALVPVPS